MILETLGAKSAAIASLITVLSVSGTFVGSKLAWASDIKGIHQYLHGDRVEGYEDDIDVIDDTLARMKIKPDPSDYDLLYIRQLEDRKAKILRKLQNITNDLPRN